MPKLRSPVNPHASRRRDTAKPALLPWFLTEGPWVFFRQSPTLKFELVSPRIEQLTGYPARLWRQEANLFWQLVHEPDTAKLREHIGQCRDPNQLLTSTFRLRHRHSGNMVWLHEWRRALLGPDHRLIGYEGAWLEATRQVRAEQRLAKTAWNEALSAVTLGLTHDFNNVLTGILSLSDFYLSQINDQHPFHEGLTLIRENARRATQLVQRVNELHRTKTGTRSYHNLNDVASETAEILQKTLPRRIRISLELHPAAMPLYVDATEFRHVLVHLALNAADAMPDQGQLVMQTDRPSAAPLLEQGWGQVPRTPWTCLSIQDSGPGLTVSNPKLIFDPFFTTKAENHGTGLGLYCARLFVEKHQGAITVNSVPGRGTLVKIWLSEADFSEAEKEQASEAHRPKRLLLAGPTGPPLQQTAELLKRHQYRIVTCSEAVADSLQAHDYQFDALLLQIDGRTAEALSLLASLRRQKLSLPVLLQCVREQPSTLPLALTEQADHVFPPDVPPQTLLKKLADTLNAALPARPPLPEV